MIKIGSLNISSFKLGGADCSIYLGSVKLYPTEEPTPPAPMNVITYEASVRQYGYRSSAFSGTNGQQLTITSHDFENGVGTIEFDGDIASIGDGAFSGATFTSVNIPNSVTSIGTRAFQGCSNLTSINIPSGVTSIGNYAFSSCSGLTSIDIPSGVTSISNSVFSSCSGLTSITIHSSVTSIGQYAFYNCSGLTSITIPSSVTSIGYSAFKNCTNLTSVTVNASTPPTLASSVFDNTNNCPIYVLSQSVNAYKTASRWSTYKTRIQAIPT